MKPGLFVTGNWSISKFINLEPDCIPNLDPDPNQCWSTRIGSTPPSQLLQTSGANALYPNNTEKSKIWRTPDCWLGRVASACQTGLPCRRTSIWAKLQKSPTPTTATVKFRKKSTVSCNLCLQKRTYRKFCRSGMIFFVYGSYFSVGFGHGFLYRQIVSVRFKLWFFNRLILFLGLKFLCR